MNHVGSYASIVTCNESCTCSLFIYQDVEHVWPDHIPEDCQVNVLYFPESFTKINRTVTDEYLKGLVKSLRFLKTGFSESNDLCKFQSLETCDMTYVINGLSIGGFKKLRHLRSEFGVSLSADEVGVNDKMQNLQTLGYVSADSQLGSLLDNGCFPNLRKLGLKIDSTEENLRRLHCLSNLRKLVLMFEECRTPLDRIAFPSNLIKITLSGFKDLKSKDMNTLGQIPNLQILKVRYGNCEEETLNCGTAGSFLRLQVFIMDGVNITRLSSEEGAMPRLRRAVFYNCHDLKEVTKQMRSLGRNLEFIDYDDYRTGDYI
ncbi:hypothetical protein AHAS_Ahas14G0274400 [Arachis hypogaea]